MENYANYNNRIYEINKELDEIHVQILHKNSLFVKEGILMGEKSRAIASGNVYWLSEIQEKYKEIRNAKADVKKLKARRAELQKELTTLHKKGPHNPAASFIIENDFVDDTPDPDLPQPANFGDDAEEVIANAE